MALFVLELAQPDAANTHLKLVARDTDTTATTASDASSNLAARILDLLSAFPEPLTAPYLRSVLRVRNQRLVETLHQLLSEGKIHRSDQNHHRIESRAAPPC